MTEQLTASLLAHKEGILQLWESRIRSDPTAGPAAMLSRSQLRDHIPALIDRLAAMLAGPALTERDARAIGRGALPVAHGKERIAEGYTLSSGLRELSHLRSALLEHAVSGAWGARNLLLVHAALDETMIAVALMDEAEHRSATLHDG